MRKAVKVEAGATATKASKSLILKKNEIPFLPQEVLFNILVRLPAEQVFKFGSVCRLWYNLINDRVFIQSHLEHSIPGLIIKRRVRVREWDYETEFIEMKDINNTEPDKKFGTIGEVIGSCNGLVLLRTSNTPSLTVANLITRQRVKLPSITSNKSHILSNSCGFTYVPETGIYKLVQLFLGHFNKTLTCEVLSLGCSGCNTWRCVNDSSILWNSRDERIESNHFLDPITINGIVHFVGIRFVQSFSLHIVSFDAGAEVLHKIRAPVRQFNQWDSFVELGGVLSLVEDTRHYAFNRYNVWILKDWLKGIWVKQYRISIMNPFGTTVGWSISWRRCFRMPQVRFPHGFSHGGRKVLFFQSKSTSGNHYYIAYDLDLNQQRETHFDIIGDRIRSFTHVNSLISPKLL